MYSTNFHMRHDPSRIATRFVPNSKLRFIQERVWTKLEQPFHNGCSPQC